MTMNEDPIEVLSKLTAYVQGTDWRVAIDKLVRNWRKAFIVDNLAVYVPEEQGETLNGIYARSLGRGRRSEADASWGVNTANKVMRSGKLERFNPENMSSEDRILSPYILGIPLNLVDSMGVLIMIRFGGPEFTDEHIQLAKIFTELVLLL